MLRSLNVQSRAQAVIAIQEVRLLDALREVASLLLTHTYEEMLNHLVDVACELLNAAASAIWILEDDELVLQAASSGHQHSERVPLDSSLMGQVILQRGPIVSDNVQTDSLFNRSDLARAQGWTRALAVPMLASGDQEASGAFSVYSIDSEPGRFADSEWDKKVLAILAHYAALAIHNTAHQKALHASQEQRTVAETFAALGDIAANLLHQLNNKMGTIPVRVQGIQDKSIVALQADPYLATNLAEIEKSASEAMDAVRDNLSLLHPLHLVPIAVGTCVADAIVAANLPAQVRIEIEGLEESPPVVAAKQSLILVFTNLLENAARAIDNDGVITISTTLDKNWLEVFVRDTGPGITPDLHNNIFEFNYSGHTTEHASKLGFGLWWVRTMMTRLGGTVEVESDGQHGTTFRLRLPYAQANGGK